MEGNRQYNQYRPPRAKLTLNAIMESRNITIKYLVTPIQRKQRSGRCDASLNYISTAEETLSTLPGRPQDGLPYSLIQTAIEASIPASC